MIGHTRRDTPRLITRRGLFRVGAAAAGGLVLAGCDQLDVLTQNRAVTDVLGQAEWLTMATQRALQGRGALAREFTEADMSPVFRSNGTSMPEGEAYARLVETKFADWRLRVDGKVAQPADLSLADLKALPSRTQITRHDCVEGWSAIGKWTGVPLAAILGKVQPTAQARYVVFHCADEYEAGSGAYYESIDLVDAYHPQTILAYGMNGADLPVAHGAPLRLRVERQLGYKQAKYVMRIELVDSFASLGFGRGGFWPDRGYEWYAGI